MLQEVNGLTVSRVWLGYAGVLFVELGSLHNEVLKSDRPEDNFDDVEQYGRGDFTIMINSKWKIIQGANVLYEWGDDDPSHIDKLQILLGATILDIHIPKNVGNVRILCSQGNMIELDRRAVRDVFTLFDRSEKHYFTFGKDAFSLERDKTQSL